MIHLAKRVIRAAIRRAGYEVVRQQTPVERRPAVSFEFTSLREYRRASVEFAVDLLRDSGFTSVVTTAPRGYSRPLVE